MYIKDCSYPFTIKKDGKNKEIFAVYNGEDIHKTISNIWGDVEIIKQPFKTTEDIQ